MLRSDYILRLIEEFGRVLRKLVAEKQSNLWPEAQETVDEQIRALTGTDLSTVATLTDTELLDRLMRTGEFRSAGPKPLLLARLLLEAADARFGWSKETIHTLQVQALHLLLYTTLRGELSEWPEFVPTIEAVVQQFEPGALSLHTQALLMQHYERAGQFAAAENALYAMVDQAAQYPALRSLGLAFYQRLQGKTDESLQTGNLPRSEVHAGLEEFKERTAAS